MGANIEMSADPKCLRLCSRISGRSHVWWDFASDEQSLGADTIWNDGLESALTTVQTETLIEFDR